jgi:hypothetical protein
MLNIPTALVTSRDVRIVFPRLNCSSTGTLLLGPDDIVSVNIMYYKSYFG